jgi:hypothetical protein
VVPSGDGLSAGRRTAGRLVEPAGVEFVSALAAIRQRLRCRRGLGVAASSTLLAMRGVRQAMSLWAECDEMAGNVRGGARAAPPPSRGGAPAPPGGASPRRRRPARPRRAAARGPPPGPGGGGGGPGRRPAPRGGGAGRARGPPARAGPARAGRGPAPARAGRTKTSQTTGGTKISQISCNNEQHDCHQRRTTQNDTHPHYTGTVGDTRMQTQRARTR